MDNFKSEYPTNAINVLYKYNTVFCADSIEWCPHAPAQNYFVCANYQLEEDKSQGKSDKARERFGRILLFSINSETGLKLHQTINTAAVLDQKWCHNVIDNKSMLGVVNAKKTLEIYALDLALRELNLIASYEFVDDELETLILSLDWSTGKYSCEEPQITCSDSKGNVHVLSFKDGDKLVLENTWKVHDYEAWIAAFYYWDSNVLFTGGDDSVFTKIDQRVGVVAKNRSHEGGVTSLHSNSSREFIIASGSYDGFVRLWDIRHMKIPKNEIKTPGTLWRLKWDPFTNNYLLAACMEGGVHVINAQNWEDIKIVESFYEHKKIAYGVDWCFLKGDDLKDFNYDGNVVIGSCSFYDQLLCVSKLNLLNL